MPTPPTPPMPEPVINDERYIEKCATARGIVAYDVALPMDWVERIETAGLGTGIPTVGHIVWCYDRLATAGTYSTNVFGYPRAIDAIGDEVLGRLAGIAGLR